MPAAAKLIGETFERLTVVAGLASNRHGKVWLCACSCGNQVQVNTRSLVSGNTKSCGCLRVDHPNATRHGHVGSPEYNLWKSMNQRCTNPQCKSFPNYGARGIHVDEIWRSDFAAFIDDMGPRPDDTHTLERLDNNGPYSPTNCVWASRTKHSRNTRRTIKVTFEGDVICLKDACTRAGLSYSAVRARIRRGWSVDRALSTKIRAMKTEQAA